MGTSEVQTNSPKSPHLEQDKVTRALAMLIPQHKASNGGTCFRRWLTGPHTAQTFQNECPPKLSAAPGALERPKD